MAKKSKRAKKPAKEFKPRFENTAPLAPRLSRAIEVPRVVGTKPTLYRCIAVNSVQSTKYEAGREFGPGQIVDLNETIGKGLKLIEEVRMACFVPVIKELGK